MTAIAWAIIWIATSHYRDVKLKGYNAFGTVICFFMMFALTIKELVR